MLNLRGLSEQIIYVGEYYIVYLTVICSAKELMERYLGIQKHW